MGKKHVRIEWKCEKIEYRHICMEVEKGILDGGIWWGIAIAQCSYCLSEMSVQVVVETVLRSLLWCTLVVCEPSYIVTLHTLKSWVMNEQAKCNTSTEQVFAYLHK